MSRLLRALPIALATSLGACLRATPRTMPERAPGPPTEAREAATSHAPSGTAGSVAARSDVESRPVVSAAEVKRRALEVFGDSTIVTVAGQRASGSDAEGLDADAVVEDGLGTGEYASNERVAYYVDAFSGRGRERIESWLERGTKYETMIRARLRDAGLPEDFAYLALIESGYDPHAYSRAAAVGMWQFMAPTARGMGLRVDWWVDERRDPVRSTDAAARFLKYLSEQFGSHYLAAAAYNGGPGRVARGLAKYADDLDGTTGDDVFFALAEKQYLPSETKDYVPKLIATAIVARDPARYGLRVRAQAAYAFDSVRVAASTPLAAVARAASVPAREVADLNPHVLRGVTPPGGPLWVRVPVGTAEGLVAALEGLPAEERRAFTSVTVAKRQSMATIARTHGLSARQLAWYNPGAATMTSGNLRPGQAIRIPAEALLAVARDVPDPSADRPDRARAKGARTALHVVKKGETLSHIAKRHGLSVAALMRLNGLRKQVIFPGQALAVSGTERPSPAAMRAAKADLKRTPAKAKATAKAKAKATSRTTVAARSKTTARTAKAKATAKTKPSAKAKSSAKTKGASKATAGARTRAAAGSKATPTARKNAKSKTTAKPKATARKSAS